MTEYVVGFLFDPTYTKVAVVLKIKPARQAGLFNGIGGKVEIGELPDNAMSREFKEETGVLIPSNQWRHYANLKGKDFTVYVFEASSEEVYNVSTQEEEDIYIFNVEDLLLDRGKIYNLNWLIPLALEVDVKFTDAQY